MRHERAIKVRADDVKCEVKNEWQPKGYAHDALT